MSDNDSLHQRGRALENEFFHRVDEKLQAELRRKMQRAEERQRLAAATGIQDEALLDQLLDAGFESATLTALALVPAVFVAWVDGEVTPEEREALCSAASGQGATSDAAAGRLLESWLRERPPRSLWDLWEECYQAAGPRLAPKVAASLATEIHRVATDVAKASGGTLGFGKISRAEQAILDDISRITGARST